MSISLSPHDHRLPLRVNHLKDRIAELETWLAEGQPYATAIWYHTQAVSAAAASLQREVGAVFARSADELRASEWPLEEDGEVAGD